MLSYEGDWVNGNAHGKGKYVFANQHVRNCKEEITDERIVKEPSRSTPTNSRESVNVNKLLCTAYLSVDKS
jgi:hypothetical protein